MGFVQDDVEELLVLERGKQNFDFLVIRDEKIIAFKLVKDCFSFSYTTIQNSGFLPDEELVNLGQPVISQ